MNTKRFFAAIFAAAILSISFLACDPKEDDPTPNPTPSTDVVKEIYGYYGKPASQVLSILDAKGLTKVSDSTELGVVYTYIRADSLKVYAVYSIDNIIKGSYYGEFESPMLYIDKLASNTNKFLLLFEKWEQSLSTISLLNTVYQGNIYADEYEFFQDYEDRSIFLNDYQAKKTTINAVSSAYFNSQIRAEVYSYLDYETEYTNVFVVFEDSSIMEEKSKTTRNSWFRR